MLKNLCQFIGIDHSHIRTDNDNLYYLFGSVVLVVILTFFGFSYSIYSTIESIFLSVIIATFFCLLIHNIYRLIFSISEGELDKYDNNWDITKFILKRGFILIALALFISKSIEVNIFNQRLKFYLSEFKQDLKRDFNSTLELTQADFRSYVEDDYKMKIYEDKLFDRFSAEKVKQYAIVRSEKLKKLQNQNYYKNTEIDHKISKSNFFITRIKLLSKYIPESWIITVIIILIFLSPLYIFLSSQLFTEYDASCSIVNRKIILDEYKHFKKTYTEIMFRSTGKKINVIENYEDPPFNQIKIKSSYQTLKKGSLLEWISKF